MEKLPIRPLIKQGESLSGYIIREAKLLNIDPKDLLKHIYNECNFYYPVITNEVRLQYFKIAHSMDVFTFRFLNEKKLCKILDKSKKQIEEITFSNIFHKFNVYHDVNKNKYRAILGDKLESKFRRFCPICLKNHGIYKLLWQVKEIEMCDIHKVKLQSTCPKCKSTQRYFSKALGEYRCYKCGELLWESNKNMDYCNEKLEKQLQYYNDWRLLLDSKTVINKNIANMDSERSLAIILLYVAQNQERYFLEENIEGFHVRTARDIINFIKEKENGRKITLTSLLRIIRKKDVSLEEFSQITVPKEYVDSLLKECKVNYEIGNCLSPWCKYYKSNLMMRSIKKDIYKSQGITNKAVCMGCYMVHGYNKQTNQWESLDKKFKNNLIEVIKLIMQDMYKKCISTKLNISIDLLDNIIGYSLNNNLLPKSYVKNLTLQDIPHDVVEKFKHLISQSGVMRQQAKKIYRWKYLEYYYYYWSPKVRNFFLFNEEACRMSVKRSKKCNWRKELLNAIDYLWVNDMDIGWENIERKFSISWNNIHQNNLEKIVREASKLQKYKRKLDYYIKIKKQVTEYINKQTCDKLPKYKLYSELKISLRSIKKNTSGLKKWIDNQVNQYNSMRLIKLHQQYKEQIKDIILENYEINIKLSYEAISEKLGRAENYIRKHKDLKEYTEKFFKKYYY